MHEYLAGLITMGEIVAGLFFLRFWSRTRDRLFLAFAAAFWLLAVNQAIIALAGIPVEERSWVYLLRIAAFLAIIFAVIAKNRETR